MGSWEKNHRKGRIAGTLAFALCGTALILAGTSAAAETDGVYPEQTQAEGKSEKSEKGLIQKIEADRKQIPAVKTGKSGI